MTKARTTILVIVSVLALQTGCELLFPAPPAPEGVVVGEASETSLTVGWLPLASVDSYNIYRSGRVEGPYTLAASVQSQSSFTDTGLLSATSYWYRIAAVGRLSGESPRSEAVSGTTLGDDTTPPTPGASGALTLSTINSTSLQVTWQAASDNASSDSELSYTVFYADSGELDTLSQIDSNGTSAGETAGATTSLSIVGLLAETAYSVNVVVADEAGNRAAYTVSSISTPAANQLPTASFTVSSTTPIVGETITVDATASSDPDGDTLTFSWGLTTAPSDSSATFSTPSSASSEIIFDLAGDYVIGLEVDDGEGGTDATTLTLTVSPPPTGPPLPPTGLVATEQLETSITLAWDAVATATSYQLYRAATADSTSWTLVYDDVGTSHSDSGLSVGTIYYYKVAATNSYGKGDPSVALETNTDIVAPTGLSASGLSTDQVTIRWDAVPEATVYELWYRTTPDGDNFTFVEQTFSTTATAYSLDPGTTYYFDVGAAVSADQAWAFSDVLAVTTLEAVAPTVTATVPAHGATGVHSSSSISITFSEQMDTATVQTAFSIDIGGSAIAGAFTWSGTTVTFTPDTALPYDSTVSIAVAVGATSAGGLSLASPFSGTFTVESAPNTTPVADISAGTTAVVGASHSLDGTGSSDAEDGAVTGYAWSFDARPVGSSATLSSMTGGTSSFTPDTAGTYTVRLTVTDSEGLSSSTTASISAQAPEPVGEIVSAGFDTPVDPMKDETIVVNVRNTGNASDEFTVLSALSVDYYCMPVTSKSITLEPGASASVTFHVKIDDRASHAYRFEIYDSSGTLEDYTEFSDSATSTVDTWGLAYERHTIELYDGSSMNVRGYTVSFASFGASAVDVFVNDGSTTKQTGSLATDDYALLFGSDVLVEVVFIVSDFAYLNVWVPSTPWIDFDMIDVYPGESNAHFVLNPPPGNTNVDGPGVYRTTSVGQYIYDNWESNWTRDYRADGSIAMEFDVPATAVPGDEYGFFVTWTDTSITRDPNDPTDPNYTYRGYAHLVQVNVQSY